MVRQRAMNQHRKKHKFKRYIGHKTRKTETISLKATLAEKPERQKEMKLQPAGATSLQAYSMPEKEMRWEIEMRLFSKKSRCQRTFTRRGCCTVWIGKQIRLGDL